MVRLNKICKIERAIKNKIYPKGTVLIQISATRGQTRLLKKDCTVPPSMYACIIPKVDIDSLYLKFCIDEQMEEFLSKYKQTINIPINNLKYINISQKHIKDQKLISELIKLFDLYKEQEQLLVDLLIILKKYFLENLFVQKV
ncbi:MAG: hypothetical protein Q4B23_04570 [Helcococcus sp.]|nr:hypothetical protein [Helcococcus sp.]